MRNLLTSSFLRYEAVNEEAENDLEAGGGEESQDQREVSQAEETLRVFYDEVERVQEQMASIRQRLALLRAAHDESKSAWQKDVVRAARDRIDRHISEVLKTTLSVRVFLQNMETSNEANRAVSGCSEGSAVDRIRVLLTSMLRRKLKELLTDFQREKQMIMADFMKEVRLRYYAVTGEEPSDEVLEKMFVEGKAEEILRTTLYSSGRSRVNESCSEIQERHNSSIDVENGVRELHQIYLDMAVLVDLQGEQLNDIEYYVSNAANYIEGGTEDLNYANTRQRSRGKWLCIAIVLFLVLVLLVVILLLM